MLKRLLLIILCVSAGYGLLEAWPLLAGPALDVGSPIDNAVLPNGIVSIRGNVMRAAQLTVNGMPVLYDQRGDFSSILAFPRGGSVLTFAVTDRFGRTATVIRSIFVP